MESIVHELIYKMVDIVVLSQSEAPTEPPTEPQQLDPAPQLDEPSNKRTHKPTQHDPPLQPQLDVNEDDPLMDLDLDVDLLGTHYTLLLLITHSNYPLDF